MMRRFPLKPPITPHGLPHGLSRGGIFESGEVPSTYIDQRRPTIPTDSPPGHMVGQDVFRSAVPFMDSQTVRTITGASGMGYMKTYVPMQGMGANMHMQNADPRPLPIGHRMAIPTPHGRTEGGIFGHGPVPSSGMYVGGGVPQERTLRTITMPMSGFGMSPDGLGG